MNENEAIEKQMGDKKCIASVDGICRNAYGNGIRCNGYSEKCSLRPAYVSITTACENAAKSLRNALGIYGDKE